MIAPSISSGMLEHVTLYCYAKPIAQSSTILRDASVAHSRSGLSIVIV